MLEAEEALGYHSSGRSVSFSHFGIGNEAVRALTAYSRPFFEAPPEGFSEAPIARPFATLYFADDETLSALEALDSGMEGFTTGCGGSIRRKSPHAAQSSAAHRRGLLDPTGLKLDADNLLQSSGRSVRRAGGAIRLGERVDSIGRLGALWTVNGAFAAPVLVNAAGAWADRVAALAGVAPLGLSPKRRTIIAIDPPAGMQISAWPFVHSAAGDFYMLPEAGQILVSPVDEVAGRSLRRPAGRI